MAIVESTQYPLSDPLFDARPHQGSAAGHREVNLLAIAWRGRWLLLLLGMVGGGIGWAMFERTTPRYTSASRITVDSSTPRLLDEHYQTMASATYLDTQAACIRSSSVLQVAAKAPENADLESFRGVDDRVGFLRSNIQVFVGGKDDVITVLTELPNAADAAQLVNSVVEAYISKYAEQRRTVEILTILRNEKQRRDKELEDCRTELETFRKQHPELSVHVAEGNVITLRFASLSDELNRTEIELLQAKALFNRVKKMYDTPSQRPFLLELAANQQQTLRDVELERQVKTLEQSLVSERARWGEGHPRVRLLADSLDEMREELKKKQAAIIESFVESQRQNFELLDHKRIELQAAYDRQFEAASRVSTLVAQLDSLQEALLRAEEDCDNVEERIKSVNLAEEVGGSMQVRVLDPATASKVPTYPNRSRFLAMGILAGTLAGFGLAWIRDLLDHRLRSIDETAEVLQLPVLGMLPHMGIAHDQAHIGRLAALAPRSSISEAIRTLRTALHFGLAGNEAKTLCITSPAAGDGKSTVASNLAIAMAQADLRVLLIDADMRKPTQHVTFDAGATQGLSDVLSRRVSLDAAIVPSGIDSLDLLLCGQLPGNPVELLNNGCFADMLDELKTRYDKIIIDSPPVMPVADARVVAALSDSTLLVLRAERSARRISLGARNELWRVRARRVGVVVNGVPNSKQEAYGYGHGFGQGSYGYDHPDDQALLAPKRRKKSRALPAPQAHAVGDEI